MKTKFFITILAATLSVSVYAQSNIVTASVKVYGNCSMCKKRIETALDHKGIKQAQWNAKTKQLDVVYNSSKITEQQIHEIVAKVGHDTDKVKAKDETMRLFRFVVYIVTMR
jgi:copper chaperone CopZ